MLAVDLRPADFAYRSARRWRLRCWSVAIGAACCPLALVLMFDWMHRGELRTRTDEKLILETQIGVLRERFHAASGEAEQLLSQIQRADSLRSKRAWSDLLGVVGQAMPQGGWLTLLTTEPAQPVGTTQSEVPTATASATPGVSKSPAAINIDGPRELRMSGFVPAPADSSAFVAGLKNSQAFAKVELVQCRQEPVHDGLYYRFDIVCSW